VIGVDAGLLLVVLVCGAATAVLVVVRRQRQAAARARLQAFVDARRPAAGGPAGNGAVGGAAVHVGHGPLARVRPPGTDERPGRFGTLPLPPAQQQLTARAPAGDGGQRFTVEPPAGLPTFDVVGGMAAFKRELENTVGLLLRHPVAAERYGIVWNGLLLYGPPGVGKTFLARAVAGQFGLNLLHLSTGDLVEGVVGASARNVELAFAAAAAHRPCLLLFDEFDSLAQRRDGSMHAEERRTVNQLLTSLEQHREQHDLVVVATTNDLGHLDPAVVREGRFDRHVRVDLPDAAARSAVLEVQLRDRPACAAVDLDDLAARTEGLTAAALSQVADAAALAAFREAAQGGAIVRITQAHLLDALAARGGRDRPTVEGWDWDALVLPAAVQAELQQVQALVEDPDLARSFGVTPPSGILLAGPPGTGKTSVGRVLAAQARCSFYPVSVADVLSKWVGDSERRVAELFERARANRPAIVFIDEIDALGARRGTGSTDAVSRLLSQLLQEIDGLVGAEGMLVVGATNRPEDLDPALVRGGRLSRTITLPLPGRDERLAMLQLMTARMPTVDVALPALAAATAGLSGADLRALCQQAALHALMRARGAAGAGGPVPALATPATAGPAVGGGHAVVHADFERALADRRETVAVHAGGA
jgi:transitional endoplasmic reticulum ATPase